MAKKKKAKRTGSSNLMSKLKGLQKGWKNRKPRKAGFPVPDDDYGMEILSAVIEEARSSKRLQINYTLQVIDGDYEGKECHKYAGLETDDNIDYASGDLETLELELPDDIGDLGTVLESAAGLQVDVTVRTSDSFTNIDFNELLQESGDEEEEEEEESEEDEGEEEADEVEGEEEADEDEAEEEEESSEDEWPTEEEIKKLNAKDLIALAKEAGVKNTKKYKGKTKKLAKVVIDAIYED